MRIPLYVKCLEDSCDFKQYVWISLKDSEVKYSCESCKNKNEAPLMRGLTIGYRLLCRSYYELFKTRDYSLSIVFSATAFDCELTRLHNKWIENKCLDEGRITDWVKGLAYTKEELESLLRGYQNVTKKIKKTTALMCPIGFEEFVKGQQDLWQTIEDGFPILKDGDMVGSFVKELFWPRNRILHNGYSEFSEVEAIKCHNLAKLGLFILGEMNKEKITKK